MSLVDYFRKPKKFVLGGLLTIFLNFGIACDYGEETDEKIITKYEPIRVVFSIPYNPIEDCKEFGEEIGCIFQTAMPFYNMDAKLGDWCEYCGERFANCMMAYQTECEKVFPEEYGICAQTGNCILQCSRDFCR